MSSGLGPGSLGPVTMRSGEGPTPGLPRPPERAHGPLRWFSIGAATGVIGTLIVVGLIIAFA